MNPTKQLYEAAKAVTNPNFSIDQIYRNLDKLQEAISAHVAKETAPLQAEIDRLKKEVERLDSGKWISVGERLPDKTDRYLVMLKYPAGGLDFAICVFYNDHRQYFDHFLEDRITHWQHLPQPK